MQNTIKMDDLGVPLFSETSIYLQKYPSFVGKSTGAPWVASGRGKLRRFQGTNVIGNAKTPAIILLSTLFFGNPVTWEFAVYKGGDYFISHEIRIPSLNNHYIYS